MALIMEPPDLKDFYDHTAKLVEVLVKSRNPEFQQHIQAMNGMYLHWHDMFRQPVPEGVSPKEVWVFLKFMRNSNRELACFTNKKDEPFSYTIPSFMWKLISDIDKLGGGSITADSPEGLPSKERYIISSLMDEAIASSQLEGAATTHKIAKEMLRSGRKARTHGEKMILNNWRTMQYIRENRNMTLTEETLCKIQRLITKDTLEDPDDSGRFRTTDDIIVEYRGETVHVPPKAAALPMRLKNLCDFVNNDDPEKWIHPIIKAAMIHFWIAYDHPFPDGNGRTARALLYWYLLSKGYFLFEFLSISQYFVRAPGQYVRAYLRTETDDCDLTYFLLHNLKAIRRAIGQLQEYIIRKRAEMRDANLLLKRFKGINIRQKALIHHAIRHPEAIYTFLSHKHSHGISYETARKDLMQISKKGFLKKKKQGKEFIFFPSERMQDKLHIR